LALVRYLHVAGLPWMHAHQATRSNNAAALDAGWQQSLVWFRMTNKIHYQEMAVTYTCLRARMKPEVLDAWNKMRTLSFCGHMCSNVAWDKSVENLNNEVVRMTAPTGPTRMNLSTVVKKLVGIRYVEQNLLQSCFSFQKTKASRSSNTEVADIKTVVDFFKEEIGSDFDVFCAKAPNRLGTKDPDTVHNKWKKAQRKDQLEVWMRRTGNLVL
jgi:hypothetical protein